MMKITGFILASALVVGSPAPSHADVSADLNTQTTQMNTLAKSQGDGKVVDKISSQFGDFWARIQRRLSPDCETARRSS
jgi:hypothetical protein